MAETPAETSVVEHEVRVAARAETVFPYFTDPAKLAVWMGPAATMDPRPGGVFRAATLTGSTLLGEYVEVDPPRRIVFTWGFEERLFGMPPQSTEVDVSLVPDGDETIVRLVHRRLPAEAVDVHGRGWEHYLGRLALAAGGVDPGPDPWREAAG